MKNYFIDTYSFGASSKKIAELIGKNIDNKTKHYIIVPDNYSITMESIILMQLNKEAVVNVDFISIKRLCKMYLEKDNKKKVLSVAGSTVLINKVLIDNKKDLKYLKGLSSKANISIDIRETINALQSNRQSIYNLASTEFKKSERVLKNKIDDLANIYSKYREIVSKKYSDLNNIVEIFIQQLKENSNKNIFKNVHFYVTDFISFSDIHIELFKLLFEMSKSFNICFLTGSDEVKNIIYKGIEDTKNDLLAIDKKEIETILIRQSKNSNHSLIHKYLFSYESSENTKKTPEEEIKLRAYVDILSEVEECAAEIKGLVKNSKVMYKDISIAVANKEYIPIIANTFKKFNIPIIYDRKFTLTSTPIFDLIDSLLSIIVNNFSQDDVIRFVKNKYLNFENLDIMDFQNYIDKYNINDEKKYITEFEIYLEDEDKRVDFLNNINAIRRQLINFVKKINLSKRSVEGYVEVVREIIKDVAPLIENISTLKYRKKNELYGDFFIDKNDFIFKQSISKFNDFLDEIVEIMGERVINERVFLSILKSGGTSINIPDVPLASDNVFVGIKDKSVFSDIDNLFILGMSANQWNIADRRIGIITVKDKESLDKYGFKIEGLRVKTKDVQKLSSIQLLLKYKKRLYISYPVLYKKEKNLMSHILIQLQDILKTPCIYIDRKSTIERIKEAIEIETIYKQAISFKPLQRKTLSSLSKLIGDDLLSELIEDRRNSKNKSVDIQPLFKRSENKYKLSASILENYGRCAYKNFLDNFIKLKDMKNIEIDAVDDGIIKHKYLELFIDKMKNEIYNSKDILHIDRDRREQIKDEIKNEIIDKSKHLKSQLNDPKNQVILDMIIDEVENISIFILEDLTKKGFKKTEAEVNFTDNTAMVINVDGVEFSISGCIDRVDINDNGECIITDYKRSNVLVTEDSYDRGERIQLYLYGCYVKKQNLLPVVYSYLPLSISYGEKKGEDKKANNIYKQTGIKNKEIKIDGFKNISMFNGIDEFELRSKQVFERNSIKLINGDISLIGLDQIDDMSRGVCSYCDYKRICGRDIEESEV